MQPQRHCYAYGNLPDLPLTMYLNGAEYSVDRPLHRQALDAYMLALPDGWSLLTNRNYRTKRWGDGRVWKVWRSTITNGEQQAHVYVRELIAGEPMEVHEFTELMIRSSRH